MNLRFVYVMAPSSANLGTCSTYSWARKAMRHIADMGHYVYWCLPFYNTKGMDRKDLVEMDHPRIEMIDVGKPPPGSRTYHHLSAVYDGIHMEFRETRHGRRFYDVVLTDKILSTVYLKAMLTPDAGYAGLRVPYYNLFQFVFSEMNGSQSAKNPKFEELQALSSTCGYNMFHGPWERQMAESSARKFLSHSAQRKAYNPDNIIYGLCGISCERMDEFVVDIEDRRKSTPFCINYAHAESSIYSYTDFLKRMYKFQVGRKVRLLLTVTSGSVVEIDDELYAWDIVERYVGLPQSRFFDKIRSAHIFVVEYRKGETSLSNLEQLYLGLVGILPDVEWCRAMVPSDYPYFYRNQAQLESMIRVLYDTYWTDPSIPDLMRRVREHIKVRYNCISGARRLAKHAESVITNMISKENFPAFVDILDKVVGDKRDYISYEEWKEAIQKNSANHLNIESFGARVDWSRMYFYWYMKKLGWEDTVDYLMPNWQRIK